MALFGTSAIRTDDDIVVRYVRLDRWFPLTEFIATYNSAVDVIQAPARILRNKFKFRISDRVQSLANGTCSGEVGCH